MIIPLRGVSPVHFIDIKTDGQCRYPLWSQWDKLKDKFYCGNPVALEKTYCTACHSTMYHDRTNAPQDRKRVSRYALGVA